MRRVFIVVIIAQVLLAACQIDFLLPITATVTAMPPTATFTVVPSATQGATATSTATEHPSFHLPAPDEFLVRTHPDGGLFVGDQISIEVIAPPRYPLDAKYSVTISTMEGEVLGETDFSPFGIGGRSQATFEWVWDTSDVEPGAHDLSIAIQPGDLEWTYHLDLKPVEKLPAPEPDSQWAQEESECCIIYYMTGTAADRDLERLLASADAHAEDVASFLETQFAEPIEIVTMSRVIGHGGFASGDINITYMDRNYAGSDFDLVLHHEMVHILDARIGGDFRPSLFVEGLAVYLTGGHFKTEPLIPRTAALLQLEDPSGDSWYLPLKPLADEFYNSQHEIGYLQAAALVEFLIDSYGWEAFSNLYRDIHREQRDKHSDAIDKALRLHFGISFSELENRFLKMLRATEVTQDHIEDIRLTVEFYDTVRRYQKILDPSAYFLTAWFPDAPAMRQYGIVADLLRHPSELENIALEALLVSADEHLDAADYPEADLVIDAVNIVLEAFDSNVAQPFMTHPVAQEYYDAVDYLHQIGYYVQRIQVKGDDLIADVVGDDGVLLSLQLARSAEGWQLQGD